MLVNFVSFPPGSKESVDVPPGGTLRQVLEAAGAMPKEGEKVDLAIDGEIVKLDAPGTGGLDTPVPDGSIVTKTKRLAGG